MITKRYAGIGSRETPPDAMRTGVMFSNILAELGYDLNSGGCPLGMDKACLKGAYANKTSDKSKNRIYLSWDGMAELRHNPEMGFYDAQRFPNYEEAGKIALETRGSFERLGRGGIAHMTRNVYQILNDDLRTPVDFVFCWAIPQGTAGHVKGGTGQAVKLALKYGIPVYNLYHAEVRDRIEHFIETVKLQKLQQG